MVCSLIACARAIFFIPTAESALAGIAAPVPVGSAPELSHKRTEPQLSCPACGTYRHGLNAPGNNSPVFQHRVDMRQTGLWTIAHCDGRGTIERPRPFIPQRSFGNRSRPAY